MDAHPHRSCFEALPWAMLELSQTELGDRRRTERLVRLTTALAANPTCSLPEACESWAETKAAYRFLENDDVEPAALLNGHRQSTLRRMSNYPTVLAVQDTTTVNFSSRPAAKGLGSIGAKRGNQTEDPQGFFVHSCMAVTPEGVPLGLLGQKQWVRDKDAELSGDDGVAETASPLEDEKESVRWTEMLTTSAIGLPAGVKIITVADREADIYDLFATAMRLGQDALVRAKHNRYLVGKKERLWDVLDQAKVFGTMVVEVPRGDDRPSRTATLELRTAWVRLPSPKVITPIALSAVLAREVQPPTGVEPVEWRLLTTLTVVSFEDACQCVRLYTKRWLIERFHFTLKSGCQVEELQLESVDRLQRAVSIYSVVAWRLLHLTYAARQEPNLPCTAILSDSEWKALYVLTHRTPQVPKTPPDLKTAVLWIAKQGGFLARKHDGNPGVKVLWKGYRRLQEGVEMWKILRPND